MSNIDIQDLSELTTLDAKAMTETRGGRHMFHPHKLKLLGKPWYVKKVQNNTIDFGAGNSFVGNTVGVNNGEMIINGGIRLR